MAQLRSVRHVSASFEIRHGPIAGSNRLLFQIFFQGRLIVKSECPPSVSNTLIFRQDRQLRRAGINESISFSNLCVTLF